MLHDSTDSFASAGTFALLNCCYHEAGFTVGDELTHCLLLLCLNADFISLCLLSIRHCLIPHDGEALEQHNWIEAQIVPTRDPVAA